MSAYTASEYAFFTDPAVDEAGQRRQSAVAQVEPGRPNWSLLRDVAVALGYHVAPRAGASTPGWRRAPGRPPAWTKISVIGEHRYPAARTKCTTISSARRHHGCCGRGQKMLRARGRVPHEPTLLRAHSRGPKSGAHASDRVSPAGAQFDCSHDKLTQAYSATLPAARGQNSLSLTTS